jgi:tetratricopeptide (TPR) repeat protein
MTAVGGVSPPALTEQDALNAAAAAQARLIPRAIDLLLQASTLYPQDWRVRREAARLCMQAAGLAHGAGRHADAIGWAQRAVDTVIAGGGTGVPTPTELGWLALIHEAREQLSGDPAPLHEAAAALEAAAAGDPYNLEYAVRLFNLHMKLGDRESARAWGRRAIELDGLTRLDREVRGLSDAQRREIRAALGGS